MTTKTCAAPRRRSLAGGFLLALAALGACNAISGVDEFEFVDPTTTSSSATTGAGGGGGDGGASGAGGAGGAGGEGGGALCEETSADCSACMLCASEGECAEEAAECQANTDCAALQMCIVECEGMCNGDPACMNDCTTGPTSCPTTHVGGVTDYAAQKSCVSGVCPTLCMAL